MTSSTDLPEESVGEEEGSLEQAAEGGAKMEASGEQKPVIERRYVKRHGSGLTVDVLFDDEIGGQLVARLVLPPNPGKQRMAMEFHDDSRLFGACTALSVLVNNIAEGGIEVSLPDVCAALQDAWRAFRAMSGSELLEEE